MAWSKSPKHRGRKGHHARHNTELRCRTSRISCCLALVPNDDDPSADRTALWKCQDHRHGPLVPFIKEIARLNRRATSWTTFAALLEGLATIAHYYGR